MNLQVKHLKLIIPAAFSFLDRAGREFQNSEKGTGSFGRTRTGGSPYHEGRRNSRVGRAGKKIQEKADPMLPKSGVIITRTTETSPG